MTNIRVFDKDLKERDLAWAKQKYGVEFRRYPAKDGETVYRLVELWEKTGHSSLVTKVLGKNGLPIPEKDVAFYWPKAPSPPDPPTTLLNWDWHKNFVHGPTNLNGDVGPGMGHGAYHGEGQGGPHAVWVRDSNFPSDICERLGMLAGTFHDHLDQVFQRVVVGGEEPPGPEPEPDPPPPPTGSWSMKTEAKAGIPLLIGKMPRAGIQITVINPGGHHVTTTSGTKKEYGPGGWEINVWSQGIHAIKFEGQTFEVPVEGQTVIATFTEGAVIQQARLVSVWKPKADTQARLDDLQKLYPGEFTMELQG